MANTEIKPLTFLPLDLKSYTMNGHPIRVDPETGVAFDTFNVTYENVDRKSFLILGQLMEFRKQHALPAEVQRLRDLVAKWEEEDPELHRELAELRGEVLSEELPIETSGALEDSSTSSVVEAEVVFQDNSAPLPPAEVLKENTEEVTSPTIYLKLREVTRPPIADDMCLVVASVPVQFTHCGIVTQQFEVGEEIQTLRKQANWGINDFGFVSLPSEFFSASLDVLKPVVLTEDFVFLSDQSPPSIPKCVTVSGEIGWHEEQLRLIQEEYPGLTLDPTKVYVLEESVANLPGLVLKRDKLQQDIQVLVDEIAVKSARASVIPQELEEENSLLQTLQSALEHYNIEFPKVKAAMEILRSAVDTEVYIPQILRSMAKLNGGVKDCKRIPHLQHTIQQLTEELGAYAVDISDAWEEKNRLETELSEVLQLIADAEDANQQLSVINTHRDVVEYCQYLTWRIEELYGQAVYCLDPQNITDGLNEDQQQYLSAVLSESGTGPETLTLSEAELAENIPLQLESSSPTEETQASEDYQRDVMDEVGNGPGLMKYIRNLLGSSKAATLLL